MLTVTETASVRLSQMLSASEAETVVRIVRQNRRMKLCRDHARPNDTTFAHNGQVVLVLDGAVSEALASRILDVRQTADGPKLRLRTP
jgi:hypothetical protein